MLTKKVIIIAIPTDFPPYGFVGTDMEPQGLDIDMANYIGDKLGVKMELVPVTSANRIAYLQTKKADLVISTLGKNPEREKVIDFTVAYSPFFLAVFGPKTIGREDAGRPGRQDDRRDPRRDRGPGAHQDRAAQHRRATASRTTTPPSRPSSPGQVAADRHRRLGRRQHDGASNPQLDTEYKLRAQGLAELHRRRQGRGQAARRRSTRSSRRRKKNGDLDKMSMKWLGRRPATCRSDQA